MGLLLPPLSLKVDSWQSEKSSYIKVANAQRQWWSCQTSQLFPGCCVLAQSAGAGLALTSFRVVLYASLSIGIKCAESSKLPVKIPRCALESKSQCLVVSA